MEILVYERLDKLSARYKTLVTIFCAEDVNESAMDCYEMNSKKQSL